MTESSKPNVQAALQSERDRTQVLLAERDWEAEEKQWELEERTTRLIEEERARNDMQNRAMYEVCRGFVTADVLV